MGRTALLLALLIAVGLAGSPAQAQKMYRCGKVYQDRPCPAGQAGKVVGRTGTGAAAPAAAARDPECVQQGRDSLKIVWAREGGASLERLLEDATGTERQAFVRDVYRRPGAASNVQAAVEADCVQAKEAAARQSALDLAAALKAQREGKAPPVPPGHYGSPGAAAPSTPGPDQAALAAAAKKQQCAALDARMDRLRARERAGGSSRTMDELNEARRRLRSTMSEAGC